MYRLSITSTHCKVLPVSKKVGTERWVVVVGGKTVTGFRYPPSGDLPGKGRNRPEPDERRLGDLVFARLGSRGEPGVVPYAWTTRESADCVARVLDGEVVSQKAEESPR